MQLNIKTDILFGNIDIVDFLRSKYDSVTDCLPKGRWEFLRLRINHNGQEALLIVYYGKEEGYILKGFLCGGASTQFKKDVKKTLSKGGYITTS